mmetsp:Transcript_59688/g.154269  ORF Transcript_59688/g.154269 Transcript_59688/m.154269 type:complete len:435 (-) Transcript_59688:2-1306(-)
MLSQRSRSSDGGFAVQSTSWALKIDSVDEFACASSCSSETICALQRLASCKIDKSPWMCSLKAANSKRSSLQRRPGAALSGSERVGLRGASGKSSTMRRTSMPMVSRKAASSARSPGSPTPRVSRSRRNSSARRSWEPRICMSSHQSASASGRSTEDPEAPPSALRRSAGADAESRLSLCRASPSTSSGTTSPPKEWTLPFCNWHPALQPSVDVVVPALEGGRIGGVLVGPETRPWTRTLKVWALMPRSTGLGDNILPLLVALNETPGRDMPAAAWASSCFCKASDLEATATTLGVRLPSGASRHRDDAEPPAATRPPPGPAQWREVASGERSAARTGLSTAQKGVSTATFSSPACQTGVAAASPQPDAAGAEAIRFASGGGWGATTTRVLDVAVGARIDAIATTDRQADRARRLPAGGCWLATRGASAERRLL